jgi:hypothetical protein
MTLTERVSASIGFLDRMLETAKNPVILWSGGKDSMVVLHMLKFIMKRELPVVCWREPWMPQKLRFINRIIDEWNLEVHDYAPSAVSLCRGKEGRVDIMESYQVNSVLAPEPQHMLVARGTLAPEENLPFLCVLETFLARPTGAYNFPWDCMIMGHKSSDDDPTVGKVPLRVDRLQVENAGTVIFPIRGWTDAEVFQYHERHGVPHDETRYDVPNRRVRDRGDIANPDYFHTCTKCCDPTSASFVRCPKYGIDVNNVSHMVPWVDPNFSYCGLDDKSA